MSTRIPLPNNQHAILRDPSEVTERQRRPITRAMRGVRPAISEAQQEIARMPDDEADGKGGFRPGPEKRRALSRLQYDMTDDEANAYQLATDHATVALVAEWSFPQPVTLDGVLDLPGRTLDVLREAVAPMVNGIFLDVSPDPNPPAPSGGSNGSATPSLDALEATSPTSGASSVSSV